MPAGMRRLISWRRAEATLLGLWGDAGAQVHMALLGAGADVAVLTYTCEGQRLIRALAPGMHPPFASNAPSIACSAWKPSAAPDTRPWLDLGFWDVAHPLGNRVPAPNKPAPYVFLPAEGEALHQIPVGPVHASIIEPGHFRFTANGEHVVRLEQRLGYAHKGIESLMNGATLEHATRLAGRTSGDSTAAYAFAFAQAAEAALQMKPTAARHLSARADGGA